MKNEKLKKLLLWLSVSNCFTSYNLNYNCSQQICSLFFQKLSQRPCEIPTGGKCFGDIVLRLIIHSHTSWLTSLSESDHTSIPCSLGCKYGFPLLDFLTKVKQLLKQVGIHSINSIISWLISFVVLGVMHEQAFLCTQSKNSPTFYTCVCFRNVSVKLMSGANCCEGKQANKVSGFIKNTS